MYYWTALNPKLVKIWLNIDKYKINHLRTYNIMHELCLKFDTNLNLSNYDAFLFVLKWKIFNKYFMKIS